MRILRRTVRLVKFPLENRKDEFKCPVCRYQGSFDDISPSTGFRKPQSARAAAMWFPSVMHRIVKREADDFSAGQGGLIVE